jgi:hypothetical protein
MVEWNGSETCEIYENLSKASAGDFGYGDPLLDVFIFFIFFWNSFVPNNGCIVNVTQDIQEIHFDMFPVLSWLASLVPAEKHEVVHCLVQATL